MTTPTTSYYRTIPDHPVVRLLQGDAIALLADLFWHCNAKTKQLNPKLITLAKYHGWSYSKAQRLMAKLRDCGIVIASKCRRSSSYEITTPDQWHHPSFRQLRRPANAHPATGAAVAEPLCDRTSATAEWPSLNARILIEQETFNFEPIRSDAADSTDLHRAGQRAQSSSAAASDASNKIEHSERVNSGPSVGAGSPDFRSVELDGPIQCNEGLKPAGSGRTNRMGQHQTGPTPRASALGTPAMRPVNAGCGLKMREEFTERARPVSQPEATEAEQLAYELSAAHPQPGLPMRAVGEIEQALAGHPGAADQMRANHAAWCEYWRQLPAGKFIPQLWRWVRDQEWRMPPVARKPMSKAERRYEGVMNALKRIEDRGR